MSDLPSNNRGVFGYLLAVVIALGFGAVLTALIFPLGIAFLLLWALPSILHAAVMISRQSQWFPLPWEDQFAAVIVSFLLQIPFWLTAIFLGFISGVIVSDLLFDSSLPGGGIWSIAWAVMTLLNYAALFTWSLFWSLGGLYHDDQTSKKTSIRDAKPIHHPC